jgi:hypothetical protein
MTVSKIKMRVAAGDDASLIGCKAEHPAMIQGEVYHHLQASANITVLCKSICGFLVDNFDDFFPAKMLAIFLKSNVY